MRIAYVINSLEGGGAAFPVPAICGALRKAGADVVLLALTRRDGRALPAIEAAGIEATVRPGDESDHLRAYRWLEHQIGRLRPDAIWTSLSRATLLGQIVGARRRLPVISWQHAAFLRPANLRLLRAMRRRAALWIADSQTVADFARQRLLIDRRDLITWPIFRADPDAPRAHPKSGSRSLRIGSLGRLHKVKGYDVLLDALALLPALGVPADRIEVVIGGEGSERGALERHARALRLGSLAMAGFVEKPHEFLASLDLYIQPSRSEGFCVAAHEAMQAGLPVVASAVGELTHSIVDGVTGRLVERGDSAALAHALAALASHPDHLETMGEAGRARLLRRFSAEAFQTTADVIVARIAALCP